MVVIMNNEEFAALFVLLYPAYPLEFLDEFPCCRPSLDREAYLFKPVKSFRHTRYIVHRIKMAGYKLMTTPQRIRYKNKQKQQKTKDVCFATNNMKDIVVFKMIVVGHSYLKYDDNVFCVFANK